MSKISQDQIVGIDVSRDWLDIHCLPDGAKLRFPNNYDGHMRVAALAEERHALVCFEATGGQEWRLWSVTARLVPPAACWRCELRHVHNDVFNDVSYEE